MLGDRLDGLWEKVANLRPGIAPHVRLHRHQYRGQLWYVLHDRSQGKFLRLNAAAYALVGLFDGERTVEEAHRQALANDGELAPGREETLEVLAQLHGAEVLRGAIPYNAREALSASHSGPRYRQGFSLANPLAVRIPLFDPDRLLGWLLPAARPWFGPWGLLLWSVVVAAAVAAALAHAEQLGAALGREVLAPRNLLLMAVLFPLIKVLHELGHGLAVKAWGGEVHETGITLLVLMPVPYVDATAAWAFRSKYRRAAVGAAGVMVELLIAALALFAWIALDPGLARDLAFNTVLIASVSTLLFNGNPLLKFDAYYVLEDLVEIPNLYSRASRYTLFLIQRFLLLLRSPTVPHLAPGERPWLLVYGTLAPVYRLWVLLAIALFLTETYLVVGVLLACWALATQLLLPALRALRFLASARLAPSERRRAAGIAAAATILLLGVLGGVPVPLVTATQGVVWLPERALLYAGTDGFVERILAAPGSRVEAGQPLLQLVNPQLQAQIDVERARLGALRYRHAAEQVANRRGAEALALDLAAAEDRLRDLGERQAALTLVSASAGSFVIPDAEQLTGRYLRQGDRIGYLVEPGARLVRALVSQREIGLLRERSTTAAVRLAEDPARAVPVAIARELPSASERLPSAALGAAGGGQVSVSAADRSGAIATEPYFQVDLALPETVRPVGLGGRVYVRLDHGFEPLLGQWGRSLRQAFLSRISP